MKKVLFIVFFLILLAAAICVWMVFGPGTGFSSSKEVLYIRSDAATKEAVMDSLKNNKIVGNAAVFNFIASRLKYFDNIRPGRYEIEKGSSVLNIVRKLRNGQQAPINLTITKTRTKEDLARITGNKFEFDSSAMMRYLNSNDSLKQFNKDTTLVMTMVLPDTYSFLWTHSPVTVLQKLHAESEKFWTDERKSKATILGLTTASAYIIASIVEEETNHDPEKSNIASVYINRIKKGMPLQADPTVKFALRDFSLTRIYQKHTRFPSPYNTYFTKGLPPGPICTPSKKTLDAVLNA
ncbi:MAG: endolytic transglycosylase MltG, partial [Flavisolibacter sp.]|nr:endolytic transglycosylase MltG [Flavisolibacter sp.]